MDRPPLTEKSGGLKSCSSLRGEICRKKQSRFRLGWIQQQILAYLLQAGLRRFKPAMLPIMGSRKEIAEAVARLMKHRLVTRVKHGYYEANLDRIKQISLYKKLEFPPLRALAPPAAPAARPKSSRPSRGSSSSSAPSQQPTSAPTSIACNDRKLSRYIKCRESNGSRIGIVIPPGNGMLQEIVYDNVRGLTPGGYVHGDKAKLLQAEDLVRFDSITYAELSVPSYSDYFEKAGTLKVYFKCGDVNGHGIVCSDFVEWMPPSSFIERHGIPYANYVFRHYILPAAQKVIQRARQVLSRRLPVPN